MTKRGAGGAAWTAAPVIPVLAEIRLAA